MPASPLDPQGHLRRARRRAPWWMVAGGVVLAAAAWGHLNPTSSLLVHELLGHPVLLGLTGYLLLAWGLRSLVADHQRRLVLTLMLGAIGATVFGMIGMILQIGVLPDRDEQVLPAPVEAGARAYEADVTTDGDLVSPLVRVVVRHRETGLDARWWPAACINADYDPLQSVRWQGPSRLVVRLASGREVPVVVDPLTGQPREPVALGRRCGRPPVR